VSRALARASLVAAAGPPGCPGCRRRLEFGTDRLGRTIEYCRCGYIGYVQMREGLRIDVTTVKEGDVPIS
jgi:hypothetical protein